MTSMADEDTRGLDKKSTIGYPTQVAHYFWQKKRRTFTGVSYSS